jgi:hypothetical protein
MPGPVALYELRLGEAFFQAHPAFQHLKPEMLTYAEQHLSGTGDDGTGYLEAYVNDFDRMFERTVQSRSHREKPESHRTTSHFRSDLAIVVEAPSGAFASYGGLWFDPTNELCYVEPVTTDPPFRRMGLGTAAVYKMPAAR